jgi:hypothetical protein
VNEQKDEKIDIFFQDQNALQIDVVCPIKLENKLINLITKYKYSATKKFELCVHSAEIIATIFFKKSHDEQVHSDARSNQVCCELHLRLVCYSTRYSFCGTTHNTICNWCGLSASRTFETTQASKQMPWMSPLPSLPPFRLAHLDDLTYYYLNLQRIRNANISILRL